ncbi:MAG TPA: AI-2E family transporter [Sphingomicrobium sp.]|nr:AI-2E family transporter [Sphingomicrobium sp.]
MARPKDELIEGDALFVRRVLITISIVAGALLLWHLREVLVLLFGAILVATIFRAIAAPMHKYLHLPERLAVALAVLLIVALIGGTIALIGTQVSAESQVIADLLPKAARIVDARLSSIGLDHPVEQLMGKSGPGLLIGSNLRGFVSSASLGIASFLILFFGGVFLAAQPKLYGIGFIKLIPSARRRVIADAMEDSARALRLWLKGQLWAMILIFLMTWLGLQFIGVPSALVLGLISGVLEFIPYAGAIASAIPAILVGLAQGPEVAVAVVALYVIVHHVEAYLIQPVIQQFAVEIPAVITLFCLLAFGLLFGLIGILLAAPLAVVSYVLIKRLYVIEALDTPTPIPGEDKT